MSSVDQYRMHSMPSAQCHICVYRNDKGDIDEISLVSYSTRVITIQHILADDSYKMFCTGTYSRTTARHINRFTAEFFGASKYYACKGALREKFFVNVDLGYFVCDCDTDRIVKRVADYVKSGKPFYGRY